MKNEAKAQSGPGDPASRSFTRRLILVFGQGFGTGLIPVAPGTFGTIPGILLFAGMVATGQPLLFLLLIPLLFILSVMVCGWSARILGDGDPGSVVMDEYTGMALSLSPWPFMWMQSHGHWPVLAELVKDPAAPWTVLTAFFLFRIFDISKPWLIGSSQRLPGGWGITVDDWLAAIPSAAGTALVVKLLNHTPAIVP